MGTGRGSSGRGKDCLFLLPCPAPGQNVPLTLISESEVRGSTCRMAGYSQKHCSSFQYPSNLKTRMIVIFDLWIQPQGLETAVHEERR